ncbi:MAG TPA: hypothetical protein VFP37_05935, partial [Steroidobacteraceae bacterium]|nr:hypothetical protein [Steroidobacteraceae bacterium]
MPAKLLKTGFALLWLCLVGAGSTGCTTTARLDHFGALSQAGVAYARAVDTLIDTAATGSIEADTATLLVQRELEEDR